VRVLILNTDYEPFIRDLYGRNPGLETRTYTEQMLARNESLFGVADFYSSNLRKLGHEAWDIHANNEYMQKAWAGENGIRVQKPAEISRRRQDALATATKIIARPSLRHLKRWLRPLGRFLNGQASWFREILAAQIKHYRPDVLLNQNMGVSTRFLKEMKPYVRLLVGQHAATVLSDGEDFSCYDLVVSSFPPTVDYFLLKGLKAELHRLAFEPEVLSRLEKGEPKYDVTFVGSFQSVHTSRVALLEALCARFPHTKIWGPEIEHVSRSSVIRACYVGQAFGRDMYQILSDSKITLNHHGDIPPYANNMRLFEATGVGTMLVTDWKANLHEMFQPGKEVIAYRTPEECAEMISFYLEHETERRIIARAGQQRTLRDHTYYQRMQELVEIIDRYAGCRQRGGRSKTLAAGRTG
jgi:hypothetical protein